MKLFKRSPLNSMHTRLKLQLTENLSFVGSFLISMIFSTWWPETLISPLEIPTTSLPAVNFVYCLTSTWRSERDYKTELYKAGSFIKVRALDFCLQTSKPKFLVYSKYKLKISSAKRLASTPPAPGTTWKWSIDTEHQFCSILASWHLYNRILLIIFFWRDKQLTDLPYQFTEGLIHLISTLILEDTCDLISPFLNQLQLTFSSPPHPPERAVATLLALPYSWTFWTVVMNPLLNTP